MSFPAVMGAWSADGPRALAHLGGEVGRQAALIGYLNAFEAYMFTCLAVVPLILMVRIKR